MKIINYDNFIISAEELAALTASPKGSDKDQGRAARIYPGAKSLVYTAGYSRGKIHYFKPVLFKRRRP